MSSDEYVEVSEKEIANVTERSFVVGDVAEGDFILVKPARKRSISSYIAEIMNDIHGYECEITYYKWLDNSNKFVRSALFCGLTQRKMVVTY